MSGVTPTGFDQKMIDDILSDIEARQKTAFGAQLNTGGESTLGQYNASLAASIAEAWEVLGAVYRSFYPDSANDESLDNVAAITGVTRLPATKSDMAVTCGGTPGTLLLTGRVVSVAGSGDRFVSTEDKTIGGGGTIDVAFEAEEFGPIAAVAGALNIETPVSGWATAANALDADLGRDLETDEDFRLRRADLLRAQGDATVEAIRADLLEVDDVEQVFVRTNRTDFTDGNNLPPHSVEAIVDGGADVDVAQQLFESVAAGIETYGHTGQKVTETITDSQGIDHTINFTRPDDVDVWIIADVDVDDDYPADGDDQIKAALVTLGDALRVSDDVIFERFQAEVFTISGVVDSTDFRIGIAAFPTGQVNISITLRELAKFDTSRITVTSTPI